MLNIALLEDTIKTPYLFKGHNSANKHSIIKSVKYVQGLEVLINPDFFYSHYLSSTGEIVIKGS